MNEKVQVAYLYTSRQKSYHRYGRCINGRLVDEEKALEAGLTACLRCFRKKH